MRIQFSRFSGELYLPSHFSTATFNAKNGKIIFEFFKKYFFRIIRHKKKPTSSS